MEELTKFEESVVNIYSNMNNVFTDDEEARNPVEMVDFGSDGNKLFTAELLAMAMQYKALTGEYCGLLDFIGILNKLAFQYLQESAEKK